MRLRTISRSKVPERRDNPRDDVPVCSLMSRWRMKSCFSDRVYILLILMLCFGIPTIIIITSYTAILIKVSQEKNNIDLPIKSHLVPRNTNAPCTHTTGEG